MEIFASRSVDMEALEAGAEGGPVEAEQPGGRGAVAVGGGERLGEEHSFHLLGELPVELSISRIAERGKIGGCPAADGLVE